MTKVIPLSLKPVTRGQAGKLCDKLSHRLQMSKTLKSEPFEKVLKNPLRNKALLDDIVAAVQKHVDALGDIIRVDRSIRPVYPDWMEKPMHPELEMTGPAEFDAGKLEQFLLEKQKTGVVKGNDIYEHLKQTDTLKTCVGLRDLEEIQKKGIDFFRKHFAGKAVFGFRSVVLGRDYGRLRVPYLLESDGQAVLYWISLGVVWGADDPALRFAS
jgi:hypothetical protein